MQWNPTRVYILVTMGAYTSQGNVGFSGRYALDALAELARVSRFTREALTYRFTGGAILRAQKPMFIPSDLL